jgi:hypothetical protein
MRVGLSQQDLIELLRRAGTHLPSPSYDRLLSLGWSQWRAAGLVEKVRVDMRA